MGSAAEHAAPGEEQVVFSRTAGVVASKVSYIDVLDSTNDWNILENPVRRSKRTTTTTTYYAAQRRYVCAGLFFLFCHVHY